MPFRVGNGELRLGDCLDLMDDIPDQSIDLVITSPPYDDLRSYNGENDWSYDRFKLVANRLSALVKEGGAIIWVVGDGTIKGSETGSSFRQALYFKDECGLRLHDTMIWRKSNFSNPSSTRYHQVFEYMFVLTKGKPVFNPIKDRKNIYANVKGSNGRNTSRQADGTMVERAMKVNSEYGMRHNVWDMNTSGQDREFNDHPATFPIRLAHDHVLSWSNVGDTVLDPFMGSGTTAIAAERTGRKWIGLERDPTYWKISCDRLSEEIKSI